MHQRLIVAIIVTCDLGLKATKSCSIQRANSQAKRHNTTALSTCHVWSVVCGLSFVHIIE